MKPIRIAICGGGACGLAVLLSLLNEAKGDSSIDHIYVFEKRPRAGPGLAYSSGCGNAAINMRADTMGLYASDPLHFSRWLSLNRPQFVGNNFPPRYVYGEYLESLFESASEQAAYQAIGLDVVHCEIVCAVRYHNGFQLLDDCNVHYTVNNIVLALGNFPRRSVSWQVDEPGYFPSPWPLDQLDQIPHTSSICVSGTRLSAIDVALHLAGNGHTGLIYLVSRGGRLPKIQNHRLAKPYQQQHALHILARELSTLTCRRRSFQILKEGLKSLAEQVGIDWTRFLLKIEPAKQFSLDLIDATQGTAYWRPLVDSIAPLLERYWNTISAEDQTTFMKSWNSLWHTYVHAIPCETALHFQEMVNEGRIVVIDSEEICSNGNGYNISVESGHVHTDVFIEATGLELDVSRIESPFVHSLLSLNLVAPHHAGGFDVDQNTLQSKSAADVYVLGSLTTGVHFYTNGIDCNVTHASRIARHLVGKTIYPPAHIAIVLLNESRAWSKISVAVVPALLKHNLIPFIYSSRSSSPNGTQPSTDDGSAEPVDIPFVSTAESEHHHQSEMQEFSLSVLEKISEAFGMLVSSCEDLAPNIARLFDEHYIDVGLLFGDEKDFGKVLEPAYVLKRLPFRSHVHFLSKAQNQQKVKHSDGFESSLNHSEEQMSHYEQQTVDAITSVLHE